MTKALFTHSAPPPDEWNDLQLCREVYHCRPSQLDEEEAGVIRTHKALLTTEYEVKSAQAAAKGSGAAAARSRPRGSFRRR